MLNPISTPIPSDSIGESSESLESSGDTAGSSFAARVSEERELVLPEPDPQQIAVLTNKLPDTPILPWNHYDSPWREDEEDTEEVSIPSESAEVQRLGTEGEASEGDEVD